ncbi:hypothetical protein AB1Y20_022185 [Prymnesium parvum]|uniref:[phosphatase 2A protein]-leucine-carboxy methyltransferase n=1 Tax=Prymnesium parvum TaxID=97485 RepID=A0AB34JFL8_PRYPA|mmetsp:Transcript_25810/g.63856  ORF Transcript_25810/g.63856 Transcript_25810/m.63856 type:complete len:413 (+) Transcript_25810:26-1264(+)
MATEGLALTAEVAARGKLSAVRAHFYHDPYAHHFVPHSARERSLGAMINSGQYARVAAIGSVVEQFMAAVGGGCGQIVSLGAGFDTRFWSLHASALAPACYVEIDQECVVQRKASIVASSPELLRALPEGRACCGGKGIASAHYKCLAADLTDITALERALAIAGWVPTVPTLVIAECLLVYMKAEEAAALLRWFSERCQCAAFAAYEQVEPDDPFGQMMVRNLDERGCPLLGIHACPTVTAQKQRAIDLGWSHAEAMDIAHFFHHVFTKAERRRIRRLEMLDEVEEFELFLHHYCVMLAKKDEASEHLFDSLTLSRPIDRPPIDAEKQAVYSSAPVCQTHSPLTMPGSGLCDAHQTQSAREQSMPLLPVTNICETEDDLDHTPDWCKDKADQGVSCGEYEGYSPTSDHSHP